MLASNLAAELSAIVGPENLTLDQPTLSLWTKNTLDSNRQIHSIVRPGNQAEATQVIHCCIKNKIPFHPVSTGKNWGYGGATPVANQVLILDLSRLNRIIEFNSDLSYVVVEPGVTQMDLYNFMKENHHDFMVPTTGAGPDASLLGNALERGYGITPVEDHFSSLLSLKAILPNGTIYNSALHEIGGDYVDHLFKWKIGPYLDGLFTQSNFGVVLEGTIGLAPKPENVSQFVVFLSDEEFESGVQAVRDIKMKLGGLVGGVNMMNKRRLLAMMEKKWDQEKALEEIRIIELAKKRDLPDWAIVGAIYGPNDLSKGALRIIKHVCRNFSEKVVYLDRRKYKLASSILKILPLKNLKTMLSNAGRALEILEGTPSPVALPVAYLKNKSKMPESNFNPDRDDCGLIWFAPLVPLDPPVARDYIQETSRICLAHGFDPLITLTAFSQRCFDSTVPIVFSKSTAGASSSAKKCFDELLTMTVNMGLFPYRLDIDHMHLFNKDGVPAYDLAKTIKRAIDPENLFAPGRYIGDLK